MSDFGFDVKEILVRIFKYIFEGVVVAACAFLLPGKRLQAVEILTLGLVAAATLSVVDLFLPSMAQSVRGGAAFGIGANLVGFPSAAGAPRI